MMTKDVFFLDSGISDDIKIMWVPLKRRISLVRSNFEDTLETISDEELKKHDLFITQEDRTFEHTGRRLYLFPTTDCNLRCRYCYANGGAAPKYLDFETAKVALDYFSERQDMFRLSFHGGGEPTMNMDLIKRSVRYSEEVFGKVRKLIVTNGTTKDHDTEWIISNIDDISVSLDGPKDIQDYHRPFASGRGSSDAVERNIREMAKTKKIGTRATISKDTVSRMPEMVEHLAGLGVNFANFEPLFYSGRCNETNIQPPIIKEFIKYFIEAKDTAKEHGIKLGNNVFKLNRKNNVHCGSNGRTFGVTPEGYITSCLEASNPTDSVESNFIYGVIEDGRVRLYDDKIAVLAGRSSDTIERCKGCISQYSCGGGCAVKAYRINGKINSVIEDYCDFSRELARYEIVSAAKEMWEDHKDNLYSK